ncbi:Chaperone protein dnaJ [Coemansia sp. RSA 1822]|nr:Chaperone protein dnaJ [Coemansia sp. RSA 638]KAJ2123770.1 Chaperone protein dnaJ [Coemansia sp. RSA 720]KAJ2566634.1 Chaperone protein dnaJ [Coemansia sp. RSA 1822]
MEVNRDEAERALAIAQRKWQSGDHAGGLRIARKSHALYPTELSGRLVEQYSKECVSDEKPAASAGTSSNTPSASGTPQPASQKEGLRNRKAAADSDTQRTYTKEQVSAVKKVMKIKDDYYKVLAIERTATEVEIKKAYRKSALAFHPDKNTAPGADEAFKLVAHAFTVLSDKDKRAHYDRFGAESRGGGPSYSAQQQQHAAFNGMFGNSRYRTAEDEISPEDLFNMFFGGDFGQFNVQFGPNGGIPRSGVRFGRGPVFNQRGAQAQDGGQTTGLWASCMQMLPILLLIFSFFATSIVSLLFGGDSTPSFAFERTARYSNSRVTNARNVVYWVNSNEFSKSALDRTPSQLWQFEREVEVEYISQLQRRCRQEREHKRNQIYLSQGWFGLGSDKKRLETAHAIPLPACDELRRFR